MSLDALIMCAGAFVAILPFLGFPNTWDNIFFFLTGIFIIALGIVVRRREGHSKELQENQTYAESTSHSSTQHEEAA
ncbi:hypothetical protein A3H16_04315 [Candidatus Kaiserbacteria bacterium RIFCSPLOWO2_12_FULL_53_8]|uniref:Uncharacterized protein n=2 Tax=Candidatus Kaiseribacteriota TaxID=1752734 RepID=A0A1F6CX55_9BACT|nr:MAG: hypothetical protein A2851_02560 [Candidatus Kaiserbacteria bacterium RIFCSPHIGHO2_01_FULL_53_29]OGG91121.1 MAG: hypothetical protein A3H16_04315 [Candidatus Kaiserbacteria bacterium RIFCSPLOWO2_12_FULL_53_8]